MDKTRHQDMENKTKGNEEERGKEGGKTEAEEERRLEAKREGVPLEGKGARQAQLPSE